ncbi:MAG: site-specific integrase [Planctomycetota bacterium]
MSTALTLRQQMSRDLQLLGRAKRTHDGYLREVRKLACYYHKAPDQLTQRQVADYLLHLINERKFARGSLKVTYSALKFSTAPPAPSVPKFATSESAYKNEPAISLQLHRQSPSWLRQCFASDRR